MFVGKGSASSVIELNDYMLVAQQRMKAVGYKHMRERQFVGSDWVFLNLQPYKQHFLNKVFCESGLQCLSCFSPQEKFG